MDQFMYCGDVDVGEFPLKLTHAYPSRRADWGEGLDYGFKADPRVRIDQYKKLLLGKSGSIDLGF